MAGLLAETGLTLREDEVASLRVLAATDDATLERCCCRPTTSARSPSELTVEIRRDLLARLGMFGVRLAVQEIKAGRARRRPRSARSSSNSRVSPSCAI